MTLCLKELEDNGGFYVIPKKEAHHVGGDFADLYNFWIFGPVDNHFFVERRSLHEDNPRVVSIQDSLNAAKDRAYKLALKAAKDYLREGEELEDLTSMAKRNTLVEKVEG